MSVPPSLEASAGRSSGVIALSTDLIDLLNNLQKDMAYHNRMGIAAQRLFTQVIMDETGVDFHTQDWTLDIEKGTLVAHANTTKQG